MGFVDKTKQRRGGYLTAGSVTSLESSKGGEEWLQSLILIRNVYGKVW